MTSPIAQCLADIDSVSSILTAASEMSPQQRSALLSVLNDYMNLLRVRVSYIHAPQVDERLNQVIAEVSIAEGQHELPHFISALRRTDNCEAIV